MARWIIERLMLIEISSARAGVCGEGNLMCWWYYLGHVILNAGLLGFHVRGIVIKPSEPFSYFGVLTCCLGVFVCVFMLRDATKGQREVKD